MQGHPYRIGGLAALLGILAWCLEWRLAWHALEPVVMCAQTLGFLALIFCVRHLAAALFHSWRPALLFWLLLSASTIAGLFASIPFRLWMPRWANDGRRRWYYDGMPNPEGDYPQWLADWCSFGPHVFEAALLPAFFAVLVVPCVLFRIRLWTAVLVCFAGYALLALGPAFRGLLVFDYDTFQQGIALDSIALSIWPMGLAYSDAHCIFTLGFFAIIFTVARLFHWLPVAHWNNPANLTSGEGS